MKEQIKDPGDLNILISHVERCGNSWVIRFISLVYEQIYGKIKKWNTRTSRLMAGHPAYPTQKGWNTVEYVPIKDIIKKPHDKIILLQRSLESLKEALFEYFFLDKNYEKDKNDPKYWRFFKKLEHYYEKVYEKTNATNVLRVHLEDLNNYTVATFNEIFDFLEFSKENRPILVPVNPPERTWNTFSSILNKGQPVNTRLQRIYNKYNKEDLEFITQGNTSLFTSNSAVEDPINRKNGMLTIERQIQHNWRWMVHPEYLDTPDALEVLRDEKDKSKLQVLKPLEKIKKKSEKKKLHVIVIGAVSNLKGCHFAEHVERELKDLEIEVSSLSIPKILEDLVINDHMFYHVNWLNIQKKRNYTVFKPQKSISLNKILIYYKLEPDLIFIDGTRYEFINDTNYIVFYSHRSWYKSNFTVINVDAVFLKNRNYINMHKKNVICNLYHQPPSVYLGTYFPEEKEITEIIGIGYRTSIENWRKIANTIEGYISITNLIEIETDIFKKCGFKYYDNPVSNEKYRELLKKAKIFWFPIPYGQHITRRMLEAMACKVLCVFRLDNREHEQYLEELGFVNKKHYVGLHSFEDIPKIKEILKDVDVNEIIKNAYKIVSKKHTHKVRSKEMIDIYNQFIEEKLDVIVPMYNIKEDVFSYINNWFKELPIRKLFLGCGKEQLKIPDNYKYKEQIIIIDQTRYNTLGKCLAELMSKVKTNWFAFLHSDVKISNDSFEIMKKHMNSSVGGIEAATSFLYRTIKGKMTRKYAPHHNIKRAYSGFQIFKTKALKYIIDKIEDDYVYRNEDIIFQNAVSGAGYKYKKVWAMYEHHNEGGYIKNEKDTRGMFLGLLKYTYPTKITEYIVKANIKYYEKEYAPFRNKGYKPIHIFELIRFMSKNFSYDTKWATAIQDLIEQLKNKYI